MKIEICRVLMLCACLLIFQQTFAQTRTITGKVSDDKGAPLVGATISAKGIKSDAVSDLTGAFSLVIPQAAKAITVSYVGMKPLSLSVEGKSNFVIVLEGNDSK